MDQLGRRVAQKSEQNDHFNSSKELIIRGCYLWNISTVDIFLLKIDYFADPFLHIWI